MVTWAVSATFDLSTWHPHYDVWLLIVGLSAFYLFALTRLAPAMAPAGEPPATRRQVVCFMAGVVALWVGADWPVHELAEDFLFSVHMTQHMLFSFIAPPLLMLGVPGWLLRAVLRPKWLMTAVRTIGRPFIALVIFNGVLVFSHWPVLVDLSLRVELVHFLVHVLIFTSGVAMWLPVIEPLPEFKALQPPSKMFYLFLQSIVPTVPASFLTFADAPIYKLYETFPRLWGIDVLVDQQMAGLIMKIGGGLLLWVVIATIFFRWSSHEESGVVDTVSWDDFERELEVYKMRK